MGFQIDTSKQTLAYIALGSNLGDRWENLRSAIEALEQSPEIQMERVSSFREYPAVGGPPDSPPFLNAAAVVLTTLDARSLLNHLLSIERQMGRQRREKWGPRVIDLDLLLFGDQIISEPGLIVPHPLMHERRFVLEPLAELTPQAVHPVLKLRVEDMVKKS